MRLRSLCLGRLRNLRGAWTGELKCRTANFVSRLVLGKGVRVSPQQALNRQTRCGRAQKMRKGPEPYEERNSSRTECLCLRYIWRLRVGLPMVQIQVDGYCCYDICHSSIYR